MWAYYWKKERAQYDSLLFTGLDFTEGGAFRNTTQASPEYGTKDINIYAVCSSFPYMAYYNTFLVDGKPFCWMHGKNPYATDYLTYTMWESGLAETTVLRWTQNLTEEDAAWCRKYGWQEQKSFTAYRGMDNKALADWFRDNWSTVLEPGDILVTFRPRGHVSTYIGAGMVLESKGKKWADGHEAVEPEGCFDLYSIEDYYINGSAFESSGQRYRIDRVEQMSADGMPVYSLERFLIMRPMNLLLDKAGNVRPEVTIRPEALCRMQYPGLEIDRTMDGAPFGTVEMGGELRCCVTLTNHSNDPFQGIFEDSGQTPVSFPRWYASYFHTPDHAGVTFHDLTVTERVPPGTVYMPGSAVPEAELKDDFLRWSVTLAPGESRQLQYSLRVTAPRGSRIISDSGFVGEIPSNRLETVVGGKKIGSVMLAGTPQGTGLRFAENVWHVMFGVQLDLPEVQTLFDAFFTPATADNSHPNAQSAGLFIPRAQVPARYARLDDMRVRKYLGGRMIHTPHLAQARINEFRTTYLEPGDILLKGMLQNGCVVRAEAPVYLGGGCFACEQDGSAKLCTDERVMWDSFGYDFFITLRPTQAYDDVSSELANHESFDCSQIITVAENNIKKENQQ